MFRIGVQNKRMSGKETPSVAGASSALVSQSRLQPQVFVPGHTPAAMWAKVKLWHSGSELCSETQKSVISLKAGNGFFCIRYLPADMPPLRGLTGFYLYLPQICRPAGTNRDFFSFFFIFLTI